MSLQEKIDYVVKLGEKLSHSDSPTRREAVVELERILEPEWAKHTPLTDPEIMPAYRINIPPLLAQAIRTEADNGLLFEMVNLAYMIGPGGPAITEALVERMKDVITHATVTMLGFAILGAICRMGELARLYSIEQSHDIDDYHVRTWVVSMLVEGNHFGFGGIHWQAMFLLADSTREEDWYCLCELSYVFEEEGFTDRTEACTGYSMTQGKGNHEREHCIHPPPTRVYSFFELVGVN